ncbi:hypothetical protein CIG19_11115 [Enterobacterales bacterium CwR94]|nr:hypothetical protein CIG19_11115 [Enterobacterales bacterium CwR94]
MMALIFVLLLLLPMKSTLFTVFYTGQCAFHSINITREKAQTVIADGEWWIDNIPGNGIGFYFGSVYHYSPQGALREKNSVSRFFHIKSRVSGEYVHYSMSESTSLIHHDQGIEYISKYIAPSLAGINDSAAILFITPGGTLLSGIVNRPRLRCENRSLAVPPLRTDHALSHGR